MHSGDGEIQEGGRGSCRRGVQLAARRAPRRCGRWSAQSPRRRPTRTCTSIGQRESDRTLSNRRRASSVVNAESPTRRSNGWPFATRSGPVGLLKQAQTARAATMKTRACGNDTILGVHRGPASMGVDRLIALIEGPAEAARSPSRNSASSIRRGPAMARYQTSRELVAHMRVDRRRRPVVSDHSGRDRRDHRWPASHRESHDRRDARASPTSYSRRICIPIMSGRPLTGTKLAY